MRHRFTVGLLIALTAGCCQAFFFDKPIHVDDPLYLGVADRILQTPLDPIGGEMKWGEGWNFAHPNPPGWPYLLALIAKLGGWNESAFHAISLCFFIAFAVGFYAIACRVTQRPGFWTIPLVTSPIILPGINLMADVPLLAFWCWALHFHFAREEDGRWSHSLIAGLLAGAAVMTKYTGLLLIPLFLHSAWCRRSKVTLISAIIPGAIFLLWCSWSYHLYGKLHVLEGGPRFQWSDLLERARVIFRNAGGVMWMTPVWFAFSLLLSRQTKCMAILAAVAAIAWGWYDSTVAAADLTKSEITVQPWIRWQFALFSFNGFLAVLLPLALCAGEREQRGDAWKTVRLWWMLGLLFNLVGVITVSLGAVRHLQAFLVPSVLLAAPCCDRQLAHFTKRRLAMLALVPSAVLGFGLAHSDYQVAKIAPSVARDFVAKLTTSGTVWVTGDPETWYYTDPLRAKRFTEGGPQKGDRIVVTYWKGRYFESSPIMARCVQIDRKDITTWNPLRTNTLLANYYAGNRLVLPWEFALSEVNDVAGRSWLAVPPLDQIAVFSVR